MVLLTWNEATISTLRITGTSRCARMKVILATNGLTKSMMAVPMVLEMMRLKTTRKMRSRLFRMRFGPGENPSVMSSPMSSAEPMPTGMPTAIAGTNVAAAVALLALSGAITPLMSPVPNVRVAPGSVIRAATYVNQSTVACPIPGVRPANTPMPAERNTSPLFFSTSAMPLRRPALIDAPKSS